ncbi:tetratricopeptide repeat protein [uncultured Pontibacter sp.]|uniref:tetratricopeptide repeat protein n=1 Tax=uncultured Pontibacter sp. TaxID=453356 RepID=UPI002612A316|nr:tetratricopeptide repeat protein [uncultured Pontibacter sp.]
MKQQLLILVIGLSLLTIQATGQSFKDQFRDLGYQQDSLGQITLLQKWEATDSKDPELYVAYFNYYVKQSGEETVQLSDKKPAGKEALELQAEGKTSGAPAGYMYSEVHYEPTLLQKGFDYIDKGITQFPNRLDMRFGKVYMLGEVGDYANFTAEIIKALNHGQQIQNKWLWSDHKPLEDPKDVLLGSVQDYIVQLYNTGDDALLEHMKRISETVLKHHPNHIESLSNLSIVHMIRSEHDKALEVLLRAEMIAPTDHIVLSNIAQAYKLKGDKKKAIAYYEKTLKHGEGEVKQYAREQIQALKKSK